ncbi:hypothetical protein OBBRIDRAFT_690064, partial [Obba rivulosa]
MMRLYSCVISGSSALYFFNHMCGWVPRDLDLYVPWRHFNAVINHIVDRHQARIEYSRAAYYHIKGFSHLVRLRTPQGVIEVIRSARESALYPLCFFSSTLLMNYISADSFCVAYPSLTLLRRGL